MRGGARRPKTKPPPTATGPGAKKRKITQDTNARMTTDVFGCALARKSENATAGGANYFPAFGRRGAGQIVDGADIGETISPMFFFQKTFCGNFARAVFSKCFGPAPPPSPEFGGGDSPPSATASSARHIPARPGAPPCARHRPPPLAGHSPCTCAGNAARGMRDRLRGRAVGISGGGLVCCIISLWKLLRKP